MAFTIDTSTDFGKRVEHRLEHDKIVWLTTVNASGRPAPSPVWFFYEDDGTVLIFRQPNTPKIRNIETNAAVSMNFNSDEHGGNVVILDCAAVIDESANPAANHAAYIEKYAAGLQSLGMTPESFAAAYSVAIRVILQKVRGH